MKRRGLATVTALVAVAVAGCTSGGEVAGELRDIREVVTEAETDPGGDEPGSEAEEATEEPGASAEAPEPLEVEPVEAPESDPDIDITTVPDEITVEYVQAVLDELERILADALILTMEEGELTLDAADHIGEVFALRQVDIRRSELMDAAESGFPGMRAPEDVGLRRRVAQRVVDQGEGCMYVHTVTTDTAYFDEPVEPVDVYVLLESPTVERPVDINPTPWVYGSLGIGDSAELEGLRPCADK
jgi:hypothetical protein